MEKPIKMRASHLEKIDKEVSLPEKKSLLPENNSSFAPKQNDPDNIQTRTVITYEDNGLEENGGRETVDLRLLLLVVVAIALILIIVLSL